MPNDNWYLVSSHGAVIFYIATHPDCTIRGIADAMSLTQRTIWGIIGDLKAKNMITFSRLGRRHFYRVSLDASFDHPVLGTFPLRVILETLTHPDIIAKFSANQNEQD